MNKQRRKELKDVITELRLAKDKEDLQSCINSLEYLRDEEQDYFDNIPENLQYSERAELSEEAIDKMDEALDLLNEAYDGEEETEDIIDEAIGLIYETL